MRETTWLWFSRSIWIAARTSSDTLPPSAPYESARSPIVTAETSRSAVRNASDGNGRSTLGDSTPTRSPRARSSSAVSLAVSAAEFTSTTAASASSIR